MFGHLKSHKPLATPGLVLFWLIVLTLNIGPDWLRYGSLTEAFEVAGVKTALQMIVALTTIFILMPKSLDRNKRMLFVFLLLSMLLLVSQLNVLISYFYLEPRYPDTYGLNHKSIEHLTLSERLGFSYLLRYLVLSKFPMLFFPTAMLMALSYYKRQQALLESSRQKKTVELEALKNQLNPHFMFNTLNNIYALAVKRSDKTADAIATLSSILDYVLYRCNASYVSLNDEIKMLNAYISLEKLRYGDKVAVVFNNKIRTAEKIAPLLYLTLIENAFKHSSSQALSGAKINIELSASDTQIVFDINNTKPDHGTRQQSNSKGIGLTNLKQQLELLYKGKHTLNITETNFDYRAILTLDKVTTL